MAIHDGQQLVTRLLALDLGALPPDGGSDFNRLVFSSSPYLLQHADNPVDWYPWGEDAFVRARTEDRPIFLSIGYATCHWCHVMAGESFADPAVAELLNRDFVAIKVDREERPDLDDRYMAVCQLMTGSGGWPLNLFLKPDGTPFFAMTYLPKRSRGGMPGLMELLERVATLWREQRQVVERNCVAALDGLGRMARPRPGDLPEEGGAAELRRDALRQLTAMFDQEQGGFAGAPKFPMPVNLQFLLRCARHFNEPGPLHMVERTLTRIRHGGIWDQLGGGIHRYSVDAGWMVPHFEKMLYDQALLALAAGEAWQATADASYLEMAEECCSFVLRELTDGGGGFHSGLDADSEGEEGTFYLWTPAEVAGILGSDDGERCCRVFGMTAAGNFEGRSILHLPTDLEEVAEQEGVSPEQLWLDLARWRQALLARREGRPRPFRDEKVVTAWNGLMIAALARLHAISGGRDWLAAATRAATFVTASLGPGGRLQRSFHRGTASGPAFLEDYAFLGWGLLELHQVTLEASWLVAAQHWTAEMLRLFRAPDGGGLGDVGSDVQQVLGQRVDVHDGALPSANGVAAALLLRLAAVTGGEELRRAGEELLAGVMGSVARQPVAALSLVDALDYLPADVVEVTLTGSTEELRTFLRVVHRHFIPGLVLRRGHGESLPLVAVCGHGTCHPTVMTVTELERILEQSFPSKQVAT